MELNDSQMQAIRRLEGPLMVLAGPGSGKTTVITYRVLHMVREGGVPPWQVLVITFSKSAASEMEQRFRAMAGDTACTFGTFHGVFFRVLRKRYGYRLDQVLQEGERNAIVKKLLRAPSDEDTLMAVRNEISLVKNELHDLRYYNSSAMGAEEFRELFIRYEEWKKGLNKIDFDDMLTMCLDLWQREPENLEFWQQRFPYIMIDEFQDINHVQYECMRLLSAEPHNLCIVGDDDQSIYRFRGARPEFLLRFPEDYPQVERVVLETNYRSTDPIIGFSNTVISQNQVRYEKSIVGTGQAGPVPKVYVCRDQNHEAAYAAAQIKKHGNFNEIAVIYRTNMQARAFVDAFLQANIPYVVKDEVSVIYEHWVVQDILAYLRGDVWRIINKPFRFIGKAFLEKARKENRGVFETYAASDMLNDAQKQRIEELQIDMHKIKKFPPAKAIKYIRRNAGYDDHIRDYCDYRKLNAAGLYEIAAELGEAAEAFSDAEAFLAHIEEAIIKKSSEGGERVTLTTMHSAKGLEFDTVYIAGVVEGLIPHERSKTPAEIEEERRLFYVGATRAKKNLYISVIKKRHEKEVKPSRFILRHQLIREPKLVPQSPFLRG